MDGGGGRVEGEEVERWRGGFGNTNPVITLE